MPNQSFNYYRLLVMGKVYFRSSFIFLLTSCCSLVLDVARHTKSNEKQTAQQSNELVLRTNDQLGLKATAHSPHFYPLQYRHFYIFYPSI